MNFYVHQEQARRQSKLLIFLMLVSICIVGLGTGVCIEFFLLNPQVIKLGKVAAHISQDEISNFGVRAILNPRALKIGFGVALFIAFWSSLQTSALGKSGSSVARWMGAEPVSVSTADEKERQFLNVIAEVALAANAPTPQAYLLRNEATLNAFAAGTELTDSVIGISQGGLKSWSRDELQAVVAHEMGHILSGDVALNAQLAGAVSGLALIADFGLRILSWGSRGSSRRIQSSRSQVGFAFFGLAIVAIGSLGFVISRWIQSLISQQREFLADSISAQLTRNPLALASALQRIQGENLGISSNIRATELSHFFLSEPLEGILSKVFSSHPALEERIFRLQGAMNLENVNLGTRPAQNSSRAPSQNSNPNPSSNLVGESQFSPGAPQAQHLNQSQTQQTGLSALGKTPFQAIPTDIRLTIDSKGGARAASLALLLCDRNPEELVKLLGRVAETDSGSHQVMTMILNHIQKFGKSSRLDLFSLVSNCVRTHLSIEEQDDLLASFQKIQEINPEPSLHEASFAIYLKHVLDRLGNSSAALMSKERLQLSSYSITYLLSYVLSFSKLSPNDLQKKLQKALGIATQSLQATSPVQLPKIIREILAQLELHLLRLKKLPPQAKENLHLALEHCIQADGVRTDEEIEFIRVLCVVLNIRL